MFVRRSIYLPLTLVAVCVSITLFIVLHRQSTPVHLVTFYGFSDNDPVGKSIAFPHSENSETVHELAGGEGTYDDPVTMASDPREWPPGTKMYIPYLQKYVIMEDTCAQCIMDWQKHRKYHIDVWMESDEGVKEELLQCEEQWTKEAAEVEMNPPRGRLINTDSLFDPKTGRCRITSS